MSEHADMVVDISTIEERQAGVALSPTAVRVLYLIGLHRHPWRIAEILGLTNPNIYRHSNRLLSLGYLRKIGEGYHSYYVLTEEGQLKINGLSRGQSSGYAFNIMVNPISIRRCGDCCHIQNKLEMRRGSWKSGTRTVVKCGVKNNPYLPESLRYGNNMSVNHLANDCPLWNMPPFSECRRCVEQYFSEPI